MIIQWITQRRMLLISLFLLPFCLLVAEQFIVQKGANKRRRQPSAKVLRERCAEQMGEIMHLFPDILHCLADVQGRILSHLYAYLEGDKDCFLLCANRPQLASAQAKLASIKSRLEALEAELQAAAHSLELFRTGKDIDNLKQNKAGVVKQDIG